METTDTYSFTIKLSGDIARWVNGLSKDDQDELVRIITGGICKQILDRVNNVPSLDRDDIDDV